VPVAPTYASRDQLDAFAGWLNQKVLASDVSKSQIAGALGHDSIQQLNKFLRGDAVPMPATLRRICEIIGISWTEAFALVGFYGEILEILAKLSLLATQWLNEDNAEPRKPHLRHGVGRIGKLLVRQALKQEKFERRYTIGNWVEPPGLPPTEEHLQSVLPEHRDAFRAFYEEDAQDPQSIYCVVPKPMALAILIAVVGFPRRGDIFKSGTDRYAADLFTASLKLVEYAEETVKLYKLPPLLQLAEDALKDRTLEFELRRVVAAEYTVAWADAECSFYTHIARLAALEYFGVAGSSMDNITAESQLPQIRRATLPETSELLSFA
jgi:transcriptional regulator with XRE-family HTH domain